jgi:hypothetical protein
MVMLAIRNVTLEMSLKPFREPSEESIETVCRELFRQWDALCRHADMVSVMLWAGDGTEILEYRGDMAERFEWAKWLGRPNRREEPNPNDPDGISPHSRPYLYMENPPELTYGWLKNLIAKIKQVGREITGKPIRVGETFDPGPEFVVSAFKYKRHTEVCMADTMGRASFACCYARLHADTERYAGFPEGIPEGTPFGAFLGRQCRHFLSDMGFDYLWLSNGFGFGLETWGVKGAVFDGERFTGERSAAIRAENLAFWDLFRSECPDLPVETRGTNLSTGMDLASDAVPLRDIYAGGYHIEPPPNSPWAALNGDFGLELVGWMSHIAEIPGATFPFRFYIHDPWWLNSPWLDRYGREPHDIYLPLAVARIDATGAARTPTAIQFLSVDDSYGHLPEQVPNEVIPHILAGVHDAPDAAGPLLWVYPFDEYHEWTFGEPRRIEEVFFGDWFMRGAVNNGLPLNTVISTRNLVAATTAKEQAFAESALVSPVPQAASDWERALLAHLQTGGRLLLYGPVERASDLLLQALNLKRTAPLAGRFELSLAVTEDLMQETSFPTALEHPALLSGGGMCAVPTDAADAHTRVLARAVQGGEERIAALARGLPEWNGGALAWVRGTVSCAVPTEAGHLLESFDPRERFPAELLVRYALQSFGIEIITERDTPAQKPPLTCIARHANGFFFSGYTPDTTTALRLRFPQGAPLMLGMETRLVDGRARYTMPKAWHRECRVFVEQLENARMSCREVCSEMVGISRRMAVTGLRDATVRFYHEPGTESRVKMLLNYSHPYVSGDVVPYEIRRDGMGFYLEARHITGELLISW